MDRSTVRKMTKIESLDQDWLWVQKLLAGESSAFEELFNKYKTRVLNLAFRYVREREAAEDIAQEVFIKIYEKKIRFDPKAKFFTWLYRVTVNTSLDFVRRRKFTFFSLDVEEEDTSGRRKKTRLERLESPTSSSREVLEQEELKAMLQREIDDLPEKLRSAILLHQFEEMSYAEVAHILGVTAKAVERRIYHAKEELRKKLTPYLEFEKEK